MPSLFPWNCWHTVIQCKLGQERQHFKVLRYKNMVSFYVHFFPLVFLVLTIKNLETSKDMF